MYENLPEKALSIISGVLKIYCYMVAGDLLWNNWCEYKRKLGIKFGTYARRQYEYAKEYYEIVHNELQRRR